jgi:hypothetical protein
MSTDVTETFGGGGGAEDVTKHWEGIKDPERGFVGLKITIAFTTKFEYSEKGADLKTIRWSGSPTCKGWGLTTKRAHAQLMAQFNCFHLPVSGH